MLPSELSCGPRPFNEASPSPPVHSPFCSAMRRHDRTRIDRAIPVPNRTTLLIKGKPCPVQHRPTKNRRMGAGRSVFRKAGGESLSAIDQATRRAYIMKAQSALTHARDAPVQFAECLKAGEAATTQEAERGRDCRVATTKPHFISPQYLVPILEGVSITA
jgi:hypothetical protein